MFPYYLQKISQQCLCCMEAQPLFRAPPPCVLLVGGRAFSLFPILFFYTPLYHFFVVLLSGHLAHSSLCPRCYRLARVSILVPFSSPTRSASHRPFNFSSHGVNRVPIYHTILGLQFEFVTLTCLARMLVELQWIATVGILKLTLCALGCSMKTQNYWHQKLIMTTRYQNSLHWTFLGNNLNQESKRIFRFFEWVTCSNSIILKSPLLPNDHTLLYFLSQCTLVLNILLLSLISFKGF